MKLTEEEKKICVEYSRTGCGECPLDISDAIYDFRCKANSHYDKEEGDWVYD